MTKFLRTAFPSFDSAAKAFDVRYVLVLHAVCPKCLCAHRCISSPRRHRKFLIVQSANRSSRRRCAGRVLSRVSPRTDSFHLAFLAYRLYASHYLRIPYYSFAPNDQRISIGGRPLVVPFDSPTVTGYANEGIFCTRRTLETLVRRLVHATCPNVEFINGTVSDYILADDSSVRSVVIRTGENETSEIACSLVAGSSVFPLPMCLRAADRHPHSDCTGSSQVGYKVLNRVVPKLKLRRDDYVSLPSLCLDSRC